jgi:large subunit ribosomal protein L22
MARHNYAMQMENEEHVAKAVGRALPISTKHSIEICSFIRKKPLKRAKEMLNRVIKKEMAVPFRRFTEIGHKPGKGIASGRYPEKAAGEILDLLDSVEANAQFKGLNTSNLFIEHICAHNAGKQMHSGRRGRRMKRTHIEVIVRETAKEEAKERKTQAKAQETKKETVKKEAQK